MTWGPLTAAWLGCEEVETGLVTLSSCLGYNPNVSTSTLKLCYHNVIS